MSLKVLDIIVKNSLFGEQSIGYLILNGVSEKTLKKVKINNPYNKMITENSLLNEGTNYGGFTHKEYISTVKNKLRNDIKKKILIREKKLPLNLKMRLIRQYQ